MKNTALALFSILLASLFFSCKEISSTRKSSLEPQASYREQHRPQFHFSPKAHWMNDPNGMYFYDGEYHLFYQYYPDSTVWGPMHWGHAVSTDMVHWKHLPVALYPDSLGYIFSGSAVVDWKNTSGFGKNSEPPQVAIFTYHEPKGAEAGHTDYQYQGIAYSTDKGRTWTTYAGNPVLPNPANLRDFRDPKVFWHAASGQWVMALAVFDHIELWGSNDLKNWEHLSDFGRESGVHSGVWECPDLFPLQVAGSGETKWVLLLSINPGGPFGGSATQYFVGDFNGKKFTLDKSFEPSVTAEKAVWLDHGRDNYAGVTWSDVSKNDGRRLFLGWMGNWEYAQVVPTKIWRSAMTLPRTLSLEKTAVGYRVFSRPVRELELLRTASRVIERTAVSGTVDLTQQIGFSPAQLELELEFELSDGQAADFGVELSNGKGESYRIGFDAAAGHFYSDRSRSGNMDFSEKFAGKSPTAKRISTDNTIRMHLFFDAASVEMFTDNGAISMTEIFFPTEDFNRINIYSKNGTVQLVRGKAHKLKSIWR